MRVFLWCVSPAQHAGAEGQLMAARERRHPAGQVRNTREEDLVDRPSHRRQPRLRAQGRLRHVPQRPQVCEIDAGAFCPQMHASAENTIADTCIPDLTTAL